MAGSCGGHIAFGEDADVWVIAFVSEERGNTGGGTRGVVEGEFRKGKEIGPVVLLIVAIDSEVLFQCLIGPFGLAVAFGVVTRGKVEFHIKSGAKGAEEVGDEFRTTIRSDVFRDAVFGEYMDDEQAGEFSGGDGVVCGDEYGLFSEAVNDYEDGIKTGGGRKFSDEIHGDRVPRALWNWKLFEVPIGFVSLRFATHASDARFTEVLDGGA